MTLANRSPRPRRSARATVAGGLFRLGLALFDLEQPDRCLLRGDERVFAPETAYERFGYIDTVVFPCRYMIGEDGRTLSMYFGAADSCIALATASVRALLAWLRQCGRRPDPPADGA